MSAEAAETQSDVPTLTVERWVPEAMARDRSFWLALGVAVLLHSTIFIGLINRSVPRSVGDADGSADGISISVVTEADLDSKSSVATPAEPPPGAPTPAPTEQPAPPQPTPAPEQEQAKPTPETPSAPDIAEPPPPEVAKAEPPPEVAKAEPPKEAQVEPPKDPKPESPTETFKTLTEDVPDILALPGEGAAPAKKQTPPKPDKPQPQQPKAQPQQKAQPDQKKVAKLDLTPPQGSFNAPPGGGGRRASFERPPGITKSGANDDFARGVIRALQQTMPQLRETFGRVTVRIILNENGNVTDVQVVRPADVPGLNQSVLFAAKQTSYPFPPPNSNLADRTFVVTYIYR